MKAIDIGKKYNRTWVFRHIHIEINQSDCEHLVITGRNGAGKSTLLQILSGILSPSEGKVIHHLDETRKSSPLTQYIAPYAPIVEELTLIEFLTFHAQFRKLTLTIEEMAARTQLPLHVRINEFSTGMKQRVKLMLAFYFVNHLVCMDEPTSHLDKQGFEWWKNEMSRLKINILLASNDSKEIDLIANRYELD